MIRISQTNGSHCRSFASNEVAWHETRGRPGHARERPLADDLAWGTAATKRTVSWLHVDDDGFATVTIVRTGMKYWVLMKNRGDAQGGCSGDIGSSLAYPDDWQPQTSHCKGLWAAEGVLLRKGSVLSVVYFSLPCHC
jgi:hypothetical protein